MHVRRNLLCIHITRQRIGLAVFGDGDLELIAGNSLPRGNSSRAERAKFMGRLKDLLDRHHIGVVLIKRLTVQQRGSAAIARTHKRIQTLAIGSGLSLVIRDRRFDKRSFETVGTDELATKYPELRKYLRGAKSWERRYYSHVVKAVLLGVAALSEPNFKERTDED